MIARRLRPRFKLWISSDDAEGVFGDGKWRLLKALRDDGSLRTASQHLGMSYRKAWGDLKKAEERLGVALVHKHRGGSGGGETTLTEAGHAWLEAYSRFRADIEKATDTAFRRNFVKLVGKAAFIAVLACASAALAAGCGRRGDAPRPGEVSGDLVIFHAGSLAVPFKEIAGAFNKEYPKVDVIREAAGSRACARKIADLGRPCDVMGSADYTVIDALLIPEHAEWNIKFATNEMSIVYHQGSRGSEGITADNWYEVLMREDVRFGRSNPDADPCGYRAVLTMKLAEKHYKVLGLAAKMLAKDTACIRPKETDLLALLESNEIDYIFLYRSVAEQHGLKRALLPDQVNLKKPELADFYASATVEISGKKPGEKLTKKGAPMVYGVTIPRSAPNPAAAEAFVTFLLTKEKGLAIMEKNGQPSAVPSPTKTYGQLPSGMKAFATEAR